MKVIRPFHRHQSITENHNEYLDDTPTGTQTKEREEAMFEEEARAWEKVLESLEELKEYYGKTAN